MNDFHVKNGELYAEGVALSDIATKHGTPAYVYSTSHIRAQYGALKSAMERALPSDRQPLLCYACKANSNQAILTLLSSLGSGLEVVSEGEFSRGLRAGFDASRIVSTGVGKSDTEIEAQIRAGIHQINVESLPELENIGRIAADIATKINVVFRLNPNVSGGGHHKISTGRKRDKFGLLKEGVFKAFAMADAMSHVNAVGLSMHIGSQVFDVSAFKEAFEVLPMIVEELRTAGHEISRLDIGGGFPIKYEDESLLDLDAYAQWVADIILPLDTEIIMEPGRYLVGNAGVLLSKVAYVKETSETDFLILDAAMNDLIRPTLYEAYHGIEPVANRDADMRDYDVVGPICETGDTFAQGRTLPEMKRGDLAVIRSVGAYGFCMASNYNTRGRLPEILVDGDRADIIRKRELYSDVIDLDIVPKWI